MPTLVLSHPHRRTDQPEVPSAVPGILQALAALSEFGGGLALILGLLTPLAAVGIACTMVVAVAMVHLPHGHSFVGSRGEPSFELAAGYLATVFLLLLIGPGALSLDALLFGQRRRSILDLWLPTGMASSKV